MALKVVHNLLAQLVRCRDLSLEVLMLAGGSLEVLSWSCKTRAARLVFEVSKPLEFDTVGSRLPFEVEHGVDGLNLDPPVSSVHGLSYESAVITLVYDKLIAVLNIGILEGNSVVFATLIQ